MLALRHVDCRHVVAAASHRDQLHAMQVALVAAGRRDFRIETIGSEDEAAATAADLLNAVQCPTCSDPLGPIRSWATFDTFSMASAELLEHDWLARDALLGLAQSATSAGYTRIVNADWQWARGTDTWELQARLWARRPDE